MDTGLLSLKWNNHGTTFFHVLSTLRGKVSDELYVKILFILFGSNVELGPRQF